MYKIQEINISGWIKHPLRNEVYRKYYYLVSDQYQVIIDDYDNLYTSCPNLEVLQLLIKKRNRYRKNMQEISEHIYVPISQETQY